MIEVVELPMTNVTGTAGIDLSRFTAFKSTVHLNVKGAKDVVVGGSQRYIANGCDFGVHSLKVGADPETVTARQFWIGSESKCVMTRGLCAA